MRDYSKEIRELEIKRDKLNHEIYELIKERDYVIYKLIDLKDSFDSITLKK